MNRLPDRLQQRLPVGLKKTKQNKTKGVIIYCDWGFRRLTHPARLTELTEWNLLVSGVSQSHKRQRDLSRSRSTLLSGRFGPSSANPRNVRLCSDKHIEPRSPQCTVNPTVCVCLVFFFPLTNSEQKNNGVFFCACALGNETDWWGGGSTTRH